MPTFEDKVKGFTIALFKQANPAGYSAAYFEKFSKYFDHINATYLIRQPDAEVIVNELTLREFKFVEVDKALINASSKYYPFKDSGYSRIKSTEAAKILAAFCAKSGLYWDDVNTAKTDSELEFYRGTNFGGALFKYKCFLSQRLADDEKMAKKVARATGAPKTTAPSAGGSSAAAGGTYKSTGPQSQNARGLIGEPHEKFTAEGSDVYCIAGKKTTANTPYIYVNPIKSKGDAGSNVNRVLEGAANDWTDCICYFDKPEEADAFLQEVVKVKGWSEVTDPDTGEVTWSSSKNSGFKVYKKKPASGGYFLVNTECGQCAINAVKMNEELEEALASEKTPESNKSDLSNKLNKPKAVPYSIYDIDVFEEAFYRYD